MSVLRDLIIFDWFYENTVLLFLNYQVQVFSRKTDPEIY